MLWRERVECDHAVSVPQQRVDGPSLCPPMCLHETIRPPPLASGVSLLIQHRRQPLSHLLLSLLGPIFEDIGDLVIPAPLLLASQMDLASGRPNAEGATAILRCRNVSPRMAERNDSAHHRELPWLPIVVLDPGRQINRRHRAWLDRGTSSLLPPEVAATELPMRPRQCVDSATTLEVFTQWRHQGLATRGT